MRALKYLRVVFASQGRGATKNAQKLWRVCAFGTETVSKLARHTGDPTAFNLRVDPCSHSTGSIKDVARSFATFSPSRSCWSCGAPAQVFFCSTCKIIQPPDSKASYFEMFNCDRAFSLDTQKLQQKYLELQRSLHPDNFSQKSLVEQGYSEMQSALVNKAYRTLQKPLTRAVYMLELQGILLEEGTDSSADPAFLLEVIEVNEKLAETQSRAEVDSIGQTIKETLKDLTEQMNMLLNKGDLQSAKELLARMKYFANLEEKVKEKLTKCW